MGRFGERSAHCHYTTFDLACVNNLGPVPEGSVCGFRASVWYLHGRLLYLGGGISVTDLRTEARETLENACFRGRHYIMHRACQ